MSTGAEWEERAACRGLDPRLFIYPQGEEGRPRGRPPEQAAQTVIAKKVCASCPVQDECLEASEFPSPFSRLYGKEQGRVLAPGIWGGKNYTQRMHLFRDRRRGDESNPRTAHLNKEKVKR